jgi:hypothetical protein
MSRVFGFVSLLLVLGVGLFIYKQQIEATSAPGGAAANPRATIDVVGVKNDLVAIAQGERRHFSFEGKYVSLDDLISNGDISMKKPSRGLYNYSSDVSDSGFVITATYSGGDAGVAKTMSIDQTMEIKTE